MPKRSSKQAYTEGELNRLADALLHPLAKEDKRIFLLDTFIHAMIEQNPSVSVRKFLAYNLPYIVAQTQKDQKAKTADHLTRQAVKLLGELTIPKRKSKRAENRRTSRQTQG